MKSKLTVLGSGISLSSLYHPFDFRNTSGHLLQVNKKNFLIDSGEGIRRKLEELKFDYYSLDGIFISHFHPDHFDIEPLIQAIHSRSRNTNTRKENFKIYGPSNIKEIFKDYWNAKRSPDSYNEELGQSVDLQFNGFIEDKTISIDKYV